MAVLSENRYGKSRVRLVKVERAGSRHDVIDLSVDILLFGDFAASYTEGDNRLVLPTDTMKNTVYVLARKQPIGAVEDFGLRLADHFLSRNPQVSRARIAISRKPWQRIESGGRGHGDAFERGAARRTAVIDHRRDRTCIKAGIADLLVLKTSGSAFEGYIHDEYTTLKETRDRLFGTALKAEWIYKDADQSFDTVWQAVRETLLEVFATHDSKGVQHTLYAMGETVLEQFAAIEEIRLSMPNKHHLLVDLAPFGLDNPNEVFVPTDEPFGLIEATVKR
jgi:urate oxidase